MIEQADVISIALVERRIGGCRDASVPGAEYDPDPRIQRGVILQYGSGVVVGRSIIEDAQLPIGICLVQHRQDGALQEDGRTFVGRHDDRDLDRTGSRAGLAGA